MFRFRFCWGGKDILDVPTNPLDGTEPVELIEEVLGFFQQSSLEFLLDYLA